MEKSLAQILLECDAKRMRAQSLAKAKNEELFAACPKLKELLSERNADYFSALKMCAASPEKKNEIMADVKKRDEIRKAEELKLINKSGFTPEELEPVYSCKKCNDTGYVYINDAKRLCTCVLKRVYVETYGASDIGALEGSFEKYDSSIFKENSLLAQKRKQYAQNYCGGAQKPIMLFIGMAGLGKSYLMQCMAKELAKKTDKVVYINAFRLFECFRLHRIGIFDSVLPLTECDYLFIDDLGSEPFTKNVTAEYLFDLIETRAEKNLKTIISTNIEGTRIKERYGEKISSRLFAEKTADVIRFEGEDIRLI